MRWPWVGAGRIEDERREGRRRGWEREPESRLSRARVDERGSGGGGERKGKGMKRERGRETGTEEEDEE